MNKIFSKSPCLLGKNKDSQTCFDIESLKLMANELKKNNLIEKKFNIKNKSKKQLWNVVRESFAKKCKDKEDCWLDQAPIKKINDEKIHLKTFRPKFPDEWKENKFEWLSSVDILNVMKQLEEADKQFTFLGPVPSDCPQKINCELSKLDPIKLSKQGINKIGIVYNLDISTGPGTHWTAVFINTPKNEIDYFDSYGDKPTWLIQKFMERIGKKFLKQNREPLLIYNDKRKQFGNSECGMFSMYFLIKRLLGDSMYKISQEKMTDRKMNNLRKILYRI